MTSYNQLHSPADILHAWLLQNGHISDPSSQRGWPGFVNHMPDKPDQCVVVSDTAGVVDGRGQSTNRTYRHNGIQIRTRGKRVDYGTSYQRLNLIAGALDELRRETVTLDEDSLYRINSVTQISTIISIGRSPETDRPGFTLNMSLDVEPIVSS